jgi:F-type H+-transporting ATPase subunit delta
MQGASRSSLSDLREQMPDDGDLDQLSEQLFAVVSVLNAQATLRRALADPATPRDAKVGVVDGLFGSRLSDVTMELLSSAVGSRWSQPRDLLDAIEELSIDAAMASAEGSGDLDEVEDELFRFERILAAEPDLRAALTNLRYSGETKRELLQSLLGGKVSAVTLTLLDRAVTEPRGRTIERALQGLSALAARRRDRLIAHVTSAVELTDDEQNDLAEALGRAFEHEVRLEVVVDPALIGGVTVRVGDEIVDGSVARQLDDARRRLTGRSGSRPSRA